MIKSENIFYYTMIVLLFQVFRNINTAVYVIILFGLYSLLYIVYLFENLHGIYYEFRLVPILFILTLIWIPFVSLENITNDEFMIALPRYMVTFPFILFCFIYRNYNKQFIIKVLKSYCNFIVIASLSIPYQIIFGKIPFFTDSSFRAGVERYTSLAGSLTALGSLGAIALIILLFSGEELYNNKKKLVLIFIITLSMLMTLQKAALANIIICFLLYLLLYEKLSIANKIVSLSGMIIFMSLIYFINKDTSIGIYITNIFSYSFSNSSVGIKGDLISRLWSLPSRVVEYNKMDISDFIKGIGFPALSGTMGLVNHPMAHNNYFDLIFSGGIIHLVSYLVLLLSIPIMVLVKKFKRVRITYIDTIYTMSIFVILINMLIGGATFYQPVFAVIVFFMIFSYDNIKYKGI